MSRIRKDFLESLYERLVPGTSLPYACVEALDTTLGEFAEDPNRPSCNNVSVVKANYRYLVKPCGKNPYGERISVYGVRIFNRLYEFKCNKGEINDVISLFAMLDRHEWNFHYVFRGDPKMKGYRLSNLIFCSDLSENKFLNAKGVAVKRTTALGKFKLGGRLYNLGACNKHTPVLVFFEEGATYLFNLEGKTLSPVSTRNNDAKFFPQQTCPSFGQSLQYPLGT